jgi:16S rRNA (cytosine967-C5)-methyltransferase
VQDGAAQLAADLLEAADGMRVLDACAAPGGKTLAMAGAMAGRGVVAAADVRPARLVLLARAIREAGAQNVRVLRADAAAPLPFGPEFDCVLLDAPCSGLGTIRRDPEVRWRRREEDLPRFAAVQLLMIREAARAVRPGGRLVYATCSSEPEENDAIVAALLAGGGFEPSDAKDLPADVRPLLDERGRLRTLPFKHDLDAFFAASLIHQ